MHLWFGVNKKEKKWHKLLSFKKLCYIDKSKNAQF